MLVKNQKLQTLQSKLFSLLFQHNSGLKLRDPLLCIVHPESGKVIACTFSTSWPMLNYYACMLNTFSSPKFISM